MILRKELTGGKKKPLQDDLSITIGENTTATLIIFLSASGSETL